MNSITLRFDDNVDVTSIVNMIKEHYPETQITAIEVNQEEVQLKPFTTLPHTMLNPITAPDNRSFTREELHER